MPDRAIVTVEQLVAVLNEELAKLPECAEVRVDQSLLRLQFPDQTGCNWSQDPVTLTGGSPEACSKSAGRVISQAAARYNLLPAERA